MPEGSPFYSTAFLVWTLVTILWSTYVGWRKGIVRSALSLAGMFAGLFVGLAVSGVAPAVLGWAIPVPAIVIGAVTGFVAGVGVWIGVAVLGAVLFKRTEHQRSFLLRLVYGGGGAAVGLFFGLTLVWGALFFVRGLGAFAEPRFGDVAKYYGVPQPSWLEAVTVRVNDSIKEGSVGSALKAIDPMPESTYRVMGKLGQVASDPSALQRLLDQPEIRAITGDDAFVDLAADASVNEAARSGKVERLLTNEKLLAAANDPGLVGKLQKIELEPVLDRALELPADTLVPPGRSQPD